MRIGNIPYYFALSFLRKEEPGYLVLFVTSRCNARCRMCFYWKSIADHDQARELSLEEIEKISRGFRSLLQVTFSGGEPFLRDDLAAIAHAFYANSKTRFITLTTNGLLPSRIAETVDETCRICPDAFIKVALSLDGLKEKHDDIRGVRGNFEKVLETYASLSSLRKRYANLRTEVTTVLSPYSEATIEEVAEYVSQTMGIDNHSLVLARGDMREKPEESISVERYKEVSICFAKMARDAAGRRSTIVPRLFGTVVDVTNEKIAEILETEQMPIPCLAGRKLVVIDEVGNVYPCEILEQLRTDGTLREPLGSYLMGNLRDEDYDIQKILSSPQARLIKDFIAGSRCYCTYECAISASLVYNPTVYFTVLRRALL